MNPFNGLSNYLCCLMFLFFKRVYMYVHVLALTDFLHACRTKSNTMK